MQEWQTPEGPNREQRRKARQVAAMRAQVAQAAVHDRQAAQAAMQEALHGEARCAARPGLRCRVLKVAVAPVDQKRYADWWINCALGELCRAAAGSVGQRKLRSSHPGLD